MRRRRRQVEDHVSHDRWLLSYADFITLLFALFVVLFSTEYRDNQAIIKLSHAIHHGFQTLGVFSGGGENKAAGEGAGPSTAAGAAPMEPMMNAKDHGSAAPSDVLELRRELEATMGNELKNHEVDLRVTPEGFVISLKELGFFNSGHAELLPGAAEKIQRIARILSRHRLELRVEGHSDDQPIHNAQFRSNWELSTARAMTVLLLLVDDSGFDPTKISVAGYGQYRPLADDSTAEGRRMNRRVDLVVLGTAAPQPGVH